MLALSAPHLHATEIHHTINISPDMVRLNLAMQDSLPATEVNIEGSYPLSVPQIPRIPMVDVCYAIPANVRTVNVTSLNFGEVMSYSISAPLAQTPKDEFILESIDTDEYIQNLYNPGNIIKAVDAYKGINNVVRFSIPLAVAYPDRINVYKTISVTLSFNPNEEQSVNLRIKSPSYYINSGDYNRDLNILENLVENPQDINKDAYALQRNKAGMPYLSSSIYKGDGAVQPYEYCIVTPKKFADAFNRIALIKRIKGINAGIVYLENILSDERFKNGELKPSNGSPEAILREFLYWSYTNGCRYALLGGKPPIVPAAYAISSAWNNMQGNYDNFDDFMKRKGADWYSYYIPTDLFFSNFENNWDHDNDGLYGESNDKLSYNSQIGVGRIPCTTEEEVINYVHKLEFYELNFGKGNLDHYGKCHSILASYNKKDSDAISAEKFYHDIVNSCDSVFENSTFYSPFHTYGEEYLPLTGENTIRILNREMPCFINVHAHGNPRGFGFDNDERPNTVNRPYGVTALDSEPKSYWAEEGNGLDCLDNFGRPSILYASSCTLMPFDCPKYDNYGYYTSIFDDLSYNFGESYVLGKNYGGVAMIGNTRYGYIDKGKEFSEYFLEYIESEEYSFPKTHDISKVINAAKVNTRHDYTAKAMNIFGDPSLCIRNNTLSDLSDQFEIERTMNGTILKRHSGYTGIDKYAFNNLLVVSSTDNNYTMRALSDYGNEDISIDPNDMVYISRGDFIPYASDLEFVGGNLRSGYHFCNNARLGCRVSNREQTVTGNNNGTVIDAMGDVIIGSLYDVSRKLIIYAKGTCVLDSVSILKGGSLEIHCDNIRFKEDYQHSVFNYGELKFFKYDKYDSEPKPWKVYKAKAKSIHEYRPLVEEGKAWMYNYKVIKNYTGKDVEDEDLMLKLEGTKEINGKEYVALNFYSNGALKATVAYLYEDVESRKVYVKRNDDNWHILDRYWFQPFEGLLYDFNNPEMDIIPRYYEGRAAVKVESNGNSYWGWMCDDPLFPIAAVEGLGLIPYSDDISNTRIYDITPTLLGYTDHLTGGELNVYPYIYKITDKEGNVLFELKENEFSSQRAFANDKLSARVEGRTISVDNPSSIQVTITDAAGIRLRQSSETNISLDAAPGIYIISGGSHTSKLIVK